MLVASCSIKWSTQNSEKYFLEWLEPTLSLQRSKFLSKNANSYVINVMP